MFYNYKLTFSGTHYVYAGSTNDPKQRFTSHRKSCLGKKPQNPKLAYVWRKHGDPVMTILGTFNTENEMLEHEQFLIDQIFGEPICLNLNPIAGKPPSPKGRRCSPEAIAKSSASRTGQKRTPEAKEKMSIACIGRKVSTETKTKIANTLSTPIVAIDPQGNEFCYSSSKECSITMNISNSIIYRILQNGKQIRCGKAKGWSFRKAT